MYILSTILNAIKDRVQNKPVEITDIYLGSQTTEDSDTLHFVNFYKTLTFFTYIGQTSQAYTPLAIRRSAVKKTAKGEIERISYRVDNVNKGMSAYAASKDFRNKRIVTRLIFRDYLNSSSDAKIIFDGFIQSILFEQKSMSVTCAPKIGSLSFETGWPYQIQCHARFGDSYCQINKELSENKVTGTVTGGTSSTVIDTANLNQADNYWNWGTITFTSGDNNGSSRKIVDFDKAANTLTLDYVLDNIVSSGDTYMLYRGCDKALETCESTYNNTINYHGFHTIPLRK